MDIPPDVFLQGSLQVGIVYYYFSEDLVTTKESHYFVVVCIREELVVLVCATSKIEKKKEFIISRKLPPETLVITSPSKKKFLQCESAFNCNDPFVESIQSLSHKHGKTPLKIKGKASDELIQNLIHGVMASPMVEEKTKDLFR